MELRCYPGALLFSKTARERQFWRKDRAPGSGGAGLGNRPGPSPNKRPLTGGADQQGALRAPPEGDEWMLDRAIRGQASKRSHTSNERLIFSNFAHIHAWRAHFR